MSDSIGIQQACKPDKPYPDFPLFPHASKRWAKKIKGKTVYFGNWEKPNEALAKYQAFILLSSPEVTASALTPESRCQELTPAKSCKPEKPYKDFPLFPHATKRWAKKIKGRLHYFGHWNDWKAALERFQYENDYLQAGKTPPPKNVGALTVEDLVNGFLENRDAKVLSGEMAQRTWNDYKRTGEFLIESLGRHVTVESLNANDFSKLREKLSKRLGLVALGNEIGRCRVFLNFAFKNDMIERPVRMGLSFQKPSKISVKKEKQTKSVKVFNVDELAIIYKAANPQMRCFMLLALNGALGPSDLGQLETKHIQSGWVRFPRPKTQVDREFPLWAETLKAIESARQTQYDSQLVFVTKYGQAWYKDAADSPITKEFVKLLKECGLHEKQRGFYALRHTFRTVADGCRDQVAINHVMGHSDSSMGANYREWIEPERLQAVVDHVHNWLAPMFAAVDTKKPTKRPKGGVN